MSPTLNLGGIVFAFAVTSFDLPSAPTYRTQTYIMLTLRPTGLSPPVYRDQLDYEVIEDGRSIGRMYEDWHALPELRWFWSITVFVGDRPGVTTHGRVPSLGQAKARFLKNWQKCRVVGTN
jgi:hypothetical protein